MHSLSILFSGSASMNTVSCRNPPPLSFQQLSEQLYTRTVPNSTLPVVTSGPASFSCLCWFCCSRYTRGGISWNSNTASASHDLHVTSPCSGARCLSVIIRGSPFQLYLCTKNVLVYIVSENCKCHALRTTIPGSVQAISTSHEWDLPEDLTRA